MHVLGLTRRLTPDQGHKLNASWAWKIKLVEERAGRCKEEEQWQTRGVHTHLKAFKS